VAEAGVVDELVSQVDVVYHLAASVGVKKIVGNLVESITNNVVGTETVLAAAAKYKKKVLLTSTSEVYGRDSQQPFKESDDLRMGPPEKTRWSYACGKALDEYLALAYYYERSLPVVIVRLFNTVGERQTSDYGMVLPTFARQAWQGEELTIHGDGRQSRCFCHVSDVVRALAGLMAYERAIGQVFNVGSSEEITIEDLADKVLQITGSKAEKVYVPYEKAYTKSFDDITRRVPSIDKVREVIGWQPTLGLDEIVQRVVAYERVSAR